MDKLKKFKGLLIAAGIGAGIGAIFEALPQDTQETIIINGIASYRPTALHMELRKLDKQKQTPGLSEEEIKELDEKISKIEMALEIAESSKASPYGAGGSKR